MFLCVFFIPFPVVDSARWRCGDGRPVAQAAIRYHIYSIVHMCAGACPYISIHFDTTCLVRCLVLGPRPYSCNGVYISETREAHTFAKKNFPPHWVAHSPAPSDEVKGVASKKAVSAYAFRNPENRCYATT